MFSDQVRSGKVERILRRSREETKMGILKSCAAERLLISRLMALQNLPHKLASQHLDRLASAKLIEITVDGRRKIVHTTERGLMALRCYRNAMALLDGRPSTCPLAIELPRRPLTV